MKLPDQETYNAIRDLFFENIDSGFLSDEIVDWCDDQLAEWVGIFLDDDQRPACSQIVKFAWQINGELAEMEANAISMAKGD